MKPFTSINELLKALADGKKIRHKSWSVEKYIHIMNNKLVDEQGTPTDLSRYKCCFDDYEEFYIVKLSDLYNLNDPIDRVKALLDGHTLLTEGEYGTIEITKESYDLLDTKTIFFLEEEMNNLKYSYSQLIANRQEQHNAHTSNYYLHDV